jgi:hypothetical protein
MAKEFRELRERLLRAGIAPRHVRRYLTELREHLADLAAEQERSGQSRAAAEAAARARLGSIQELARTMIERRELQSWTARAPWVVLGLGPLAGLACCWAIALLILWTGWTWFLHGTPSPFVPQLHGFSVAYFGVGRMLYYWAPLLAGWAMIVVAARQRLGAAWPVASAAMLAILGATGAVDVRSPTVAGRAGDVGMRFLPLPSEMTGTVIRAVALFALMTLPWLVWRWRVLREESAGE